MAEAKTDQQGILGGWADLRGHLALGGGLLLSATLGADVPFLRPSYGVLTPDLFETEPVHKVDAVIPTATLGVGARFGR